ncbi:MAG TPA: hypothetical protein VF041_11225 [Gemmatimonadaceae bacterium]
MRSRHRSAVIAALAVACGIAPAAAQSTSTATARLREVLPPDVAAHVLARVDSARAAGLPAEALAQRALKFAAKGVPAQAIDRAIAEQADRLTGARAALAASGRAPTDDEIEAGAEAMRQGVDGGAVRALATSAPSGRSLAVPLYVIGALEARGLPASEALARVQRMLAARASDAELESLPAQAAGAAQSPGAIGREVSAARRAGAANSAGGGPPAGVPANAGGKGRGHAGRPGHP